MPRESLSTANYAAVIKDLRAQRDEIDRTIAMLEKRARDIESGRSEPTLLVREDHPQRSPPKHRSRTVNGATGMGDACARFLEENEGKLFSTRDVLEALEERGFSFSTVNPMNNVWAALSHRWKSVGDVERRGKNWRFRREKAASPEPAQINGAEQHI